MVAKKNKVDKKGGKTVPQEKPDTSNNAKKKKEGVRRRLDFEDDPPAGGGKKMGWFAACKEAGYMKKGADFKPSPKKGSSEYQRIRKIMDGGK